MKSGITHKCDREGCNGIITNTSRIGAANKAGLKLYCNRTCAGIGRRSNKTKDQKKIEKREYDKQYRQKNITIKKQKAHEYFKRTYDPAKASIERKKRMPKHIEYCRQPKYKEYKKGYDEQYQAKKKFGEFWESSILINKISKVVDNREAKRINNLQTKSQKRKRLWQRLTKTRQNLMTSNLQRIT